MLNNSLFKYERQDLVEMSATDLLSGVIAGEGDVGQGWVGGGWQGGGENQGKWGTLGQVEDRGAFVVESDFLEVCVASNSPAVLVESVCRPQKPRRFRSRGRARPQGVANPSGIASRRPIPPGKSTTGAGAVGFHRLLTETR